MELNSLRNKVKLKKIENLLVEVTKDKSLEEVYQ